jgi:hypothetical protein
MRHDRELHSLIESYFPCLRRTVRKNPKNLPASVRPKLANLARQRNVDFGLILVKYGLERIHFRLSRSRHRDVFILKGALLFELWTEQRYRPTRVGREDCPGTDAARKQQIDAGRVRTSFDPG